MNNANQPRPVVGPTYAKHADGGAHGASYRASKTGPDDGPAPVQGPLVWQPPMELLPKSEVCRLFGNINPSTLYRGIRLGRYPKPIRVGPNSSRWLLAEVQAVLRSMVEARP
jgi:predicted DNA-binding transcriptional regulator AlpA